MSDSQFLGVLGLLIFSAIVIGFVIGWSANPTDDHDG